MGGNTHHFTVYLSETLALVALLISSNLAEACNSQLHFRDRLLVESSPQAFCAEEKSELEQLSSWA